MTLEDFERELAENRERGEERSNKDKDRERDRSRERRHHRHHHHHHRHLSRSRERESDRNHDRHRHQEDEEAHRRKRSRHSSSNGDSFEHSHKRRHRGSREELEEPVPKRVIQKEPTQLKRDAWMEAPSALDIDYVHRHDKDRLQEEPRPNMLQADFELKIHDRELNEHLHDINRGKATEDIEEEPASHEVDYEFGDAGSQWRMTKLKAVYREAEEKGKPVEDVAVERFGDLRSFDDAREEEIELDRRERYGEAYVGKIKPTGELFQERKLAHGVHRDVHQHTREPEKEHSAEGQGKQMETEPPLRTTQPLDLTALNRLKAQMMKAKLRGASDAEELEKRYNAAAATLANRKEADVVVLGVAENPMLVGKRNEVKLAENKRGREKGQLVENEDMTVEDMVREERRTRGQAGGEGMRLAERIARDARFDVSLFAVLHAHMLTDILE